MRRNKFLEDLGLKRTEYGTSFTEKNDKRRKQWKKDRKKYGFDRRETWCLNRMFVEWLYSRLMMFNKANNVVDTSYYKFEWDGKEITQQEAIDLIIEKCRASLSYTGTDMNEESRLEKEVYDLMPLWGMILPCMWW